MQRSWDIDVVGVLAEDDYVREKLGREALFINKQDAIQFYIRIISQPPESFPNEKLVWCYSTYLEEWGIEDRVDLPKNERIQIFKDSLSKYFLIFGLQQKSTIEGNTIYQAIDVKVKGKFDSYDNNMSFHPIPVFQKGIYNPSFEVFLQKLVERKHIGKIRRFSIEPSDTPTYILWRHEDGQYTILGEFDRHHHAYGGFQLYYEQLKQEKMPEEWIDQIIEVPRNEDVIFISLDIYYLIQDLLQAADPVKTLTKETGESNPIPIDTHQEMVEEDERQFIEHFYQITQEHGLVYDKKDLINFHTAMKSSNLVILSGMSGTGKSKLVEMYGKAWGMDNQQLNMIPVRPSWTDDADLIGYVDSVHMVYRPGDSRLINTLIQAAKEENSDKLYIVCFDEMNLARVEHYFSQFLSVLELEPHRRQLKLYNDELESRLYNASRYQSSVLIGDNILFVGTVNIDESTYHFSDKVLDRANVITLSTQMSFQSLFQAKKGSMKDRKRHFTATDFRSFQKRSETLCLSTEEIKVLESIHQSLQLANKQYGIGFRVVKQINSYLLNLPKCKELTREDAFDLQLVQRVLTKLRGPVEFLDRVIGYYDKESEEVRESYLLQIFDQFPEVSSFAESRKIVANKAKELTINGYTS